MKLLTLYILSEPIVVNKQKILKTRGGTTLNAWEVFTDVVEDVIVIVIEEVSDFWNLYVDVVRTIY